MGMSRTVLRWTRDTSARWPRSASSPSPPRSSPSRRSRPRRRRPYRRCLRGTADVRRGPGLVPPLRLGRDPRLDRDRDRQPGRRDRGDTGHPVPGRRGGWVPPLHRRAGRRRVADHGHRRPRRPSRALDPAQRAGYRSPHDPGADRHAAALDGRPRLDAQGSGWLLLRPDAPADLDAAPSLPTPAGLSALPDTTVTVIDAQHVAVRTTASPQTLAATPGVSAVTSDALMSLSVDDVSNDPMSNQQWALQNRGDTYLVQPGDMTAGADAKVPAAWTKTRGAGAVVAVIDTPVDASHPDLASALWTNPNEACNATSDNDGDGLVGDCRGWDFVNGNATGQLQPGTNQYLRHGSHVAGIIAATAGNGVGVAGAAPGAQIMPLNVAMSNGGIPVSAAAAAINYAVDHHASVINASWGGSGSMPTVLQARDRPCRGGRCRDGDRGRQQRREPRHVSAVPGERDELERHHRRCVDRDGSAGELLELLVEPGRRLRSRVLRPLDPAQQQLRHDVGHVHGGSLRRCRSRTAPLREPVGNGGPGPGPRHEHCRRRPVPGGQGGIRRPHRRRRRAGRDSRFEPGPRPRPTTSTTSTTSTICIRNSRSCRFRPPPAPCRPGTAPLLSSRSRPVPPPTR